MCFYFVIYNNITQFLNIYNNVKVTIVMLACLKSTRLHVYK